MNAAEAGEQIGGVPASGVAGAARQAAPASRDGIEFTAAQITSALIKAVRDGESKSITDSLATLLAIHYPDEFERLSLAVDFAALFEGDPR